jgi:hypothetical protein
LRSALNLTTPPGFATSTFGCFAGAGHGDQYHAQQQLGRKLQDGQEMVSDCWQGKWVENLSNPINNCFQELFFLSRAYPPHLIGKTLVSFKVGEVSGALV